jgi:hypothetical protein
MVTRTERALSRPRLAVVGALALLVYAWVVAGLRPFTEPENILVAVPIVVVFLLAARRGRSTSEAPSQPLRTAPARHGALVWVGLIGALVAWELIALFSSPRDDHPTMSSIADWIMSVRVGRTLFVIVWLLAGVALALRPSREPGR